MFLVRNAAVCKGHRSMAALVSTGKKQYGQVVTTTSYSEVKQAFGDEFVEPMKKNPSAVKKSLDGYDHSLAVMQTVKFDTLSNIRLVASEKETNEFKFMTPLGPTYFSNHTLGPFGNLRDVSSKGENPTKGIDTNAYDLPNARYIAKVNFDSTTESGSAFWNTIRYYEQMMCIHIAKDKTLMSGNAFLRSSMERAQKNLVAKTKQYTSNDLLYAIALDLYDKRIPAQKCLKETEADESKAEFGFKLPKTGQEYLVFKQRVFINDNQNKLSLPANAPSYIGKLIDAQSGDKVKKGYLPLKWYEYNPTSVSDIELDVKERYLRNDTEVSLLAELRPVFWPMGLTLGSAFNAVYVKKNTNVAADAHTENH